MSNAAEQHTRTQSASSRFVIGERDFLLDGEAHRILAGSVHYFRVHPAQWSARIAAAKAMGLNAIETYVAWNEHAPTRGEFRTDGPRDLVRFLKLVSEAGMHAIVRPGPYICAEWDNGGLPGWLFAEPGIQLRRTNGPYLTAVREYFDRLLPLLAPLQIDAGGPIVLVQIENEYGAYGDDHDYLRELVALTRANGITVPLTTVDQPTDAMLAAGTLPDLLTTGSFGSRAAERLETLRRHQPTGPLMCSEFWDGWFDHWGEHHHTTSAKDAARELDVLLDAGASVTIYMFTGGTNFGLTNGANHKGVYKSHVTSYDYDAPLDEAGRPTEKYDAFREVLARHGAAVSEAPAPRSGAAAVEAVFDAAVPLIDVRDRLGSWHRTEAVEPMDAHGQYRGFAVYRTALPSGGVLTVGGVRDRAQVSVDGQPVGVLERDRHDRSIALPPGEVLELLVEDRGRVNYGVRLGEPKGLIGPVRLDGELLTNWEMLPLPLEDSPPVFDGASLPGVMAAGPVLLRASFAAEGGDLFLDTAGWGKGLIWVNGFGLGRYWSRGPQRTLFIPGDLLRADANNLVVLELHAMPSMNIRLLPDPHLGHTEE